MTRQEENRVMLGMLLATVLGGLAQVVTFYWKDFQFLAMLAALSLVVLTHKWVVR